jgi:hypothetical protein
LGKRMKNDGVDAAHTHNGSACERHRTPAQRLCDAAEVSTPRPTMTRVGNPVAESSPPPNTTLASLTHQRQSSTTRHQGEHKRALSEDYWSHAHGYRAASHSPLTPSPKHQAAAEDAHGINGGVVGGALPHQAKHTVQAHHRVVLCDHGNEGGAATGVCQWCPWCPARAGRPGHSHSDGPPPPPTANARDKGRRVQKGHPPLARCRPVPTRNQTTSAGHRGSCL